MAMHVIATANLEPFSILVLKKRQRHRVNFNSRESFAILCDLIAKLDYAQKHNKISLKENDGSDS